MRAVPLDEVGEIPAHLRAAALDDERLTDRERELLVSGAPPTALVEARLEAERIHDAKQGWTTETAAQFDERWRHLNRWWANVLFEAAVFSLALALLWTPFFVKRAHAWRAGAAGMTVVLLFVPYYLGYCTCACCSGGPIGGAVYPWVLLALNATRSEPLPDEMRLWDSLPPHAPLASFTQETPDVCDMWTYPPSSVLRLAMIVAILVYVVSRFSRSAHARLTRVRHPR